MEMKWFMIFLSTCAICLAVDNSLTNYSKKECLIAAMQRGMTADDIARVCR